MTIVIVIVIITLTNYLFIIIPKTALTSVTVVHILT
jgi:hypothetical protein